MVVSTILNLFVTPALYIAIVGLREGLKKRGGGSNGSSGGAGTAAGERAPAEVV
jgi:hypothetical protein